MSDPIPTTGPGVKKNTYAVALCWSIVTAAIILMRVSFPSLSPHSSSKSIYPRNQKTIEKTGTDWSAAVTLDSTERFDIRPITKNVFWQIRPDRDDSRIVSLPPVNYPGTNHVELSATKVWEWRVNPTYHRSGSAEFCAEISPRTD